MLRGVSLLVLPDCLRIQNHISFQNLGLINYLGILRFDKEGNEGREERMKGGGKEGMKGGGEEGEKEGGTKGVRE